MSLRILNLMPAILLLGAATSEQSRPGITVVQIDVADHQPDSGRGFFAKAKAGCFLITAAHVILESGYVATSVSFRRDGGLDQTATSIWYPEPKDRYDVAIFDASKAADRPSECPDLLPTVEETDRALRSRKAEIVTIDNAGDRVRIPVDITATSPRIVGKLLSRSDIVQKGISGAPLVIDGKPYAVVINAGGMQVIADRLDTMPEEARRRVESSIPITTMMITKKYMSLLNNSGRTAYEKCLNKQFEMCNLFGSALITYGLDHGDPWTQDAAAPFFALACDHQVPWACSNLALIYKNGSMTIKPAFPQAKKFYDLDCTGHGDPTKIIKQACAWRDEL